MRGSNSDTHRRSNRRNRAVAVESITGIHVLDDESQRTHDLHVRRILDSPGSHLLWRPEPASRTRDSTGQGFAEFECPGPSFQCAASDRGSSERPEPSSIGRPRRRRGSQAWRVRIRAGGTGDGRDRASRRVETARRFGFRQSRRFARRWQPATDSVQVSLGIERWACRPQIFGFGFERDLLPNGSWFEPSQRYETNGRLGFLEYRHQKRSRPVTRRRTCNGTEDLGVQDASGRILIHRRIAQREGNWPQEACGNAQVS